MSVPLGGQYVFLFEVGLNRRMIGPECPKIPPLLAIIDLR